MTHRRSPRRAGHTLVEMTIASVLSLILAVGLAEIVGSAVRSHGQVLAQDAAARTQQRLLGEMRQSAFSAVRVLGDDATGQSIFGALELTAFPPLADTTLPILDTSGGIAEDLAGARRVGNALLLVVEDRPLTITPNATAHRIDRVRFVAFYLTHVNERVLNDVGDRLDVVHFTSEAYVLKAGIDAIQDPLERTDVLKELYAQTYTRLLSLDVPADAAFDDVAADGTVTGPVSSPVILGADAFPIRRMLFGKRMSVAANGTRVGVPRFAVVDPALPQFPGGFEVKVAGPWAARRVLVRLLLVAGDPHSHDVASDVTKVFTVGAR